MYLFKLLIIISYFMFFSCNEIKTLNSASEVKDLEILAIKVDKPEAYTNHLITAKMLIGEPTNYTEEYHKIWLICDPGNYGETESGLSVCMYDLKTHMDLIKSDVDEFSFKMQESTLKDYNLEAKYIYVLGGVCKSTLEDCKNLLNNIDKEILLKNNNKFLFSFKRVRIITDDYTVTNSNPIIEKLVINNVDVSQKDAITMNNEKNYEFELKLSDNSFYGTSTGNEFIPISWKSNFGHFTKAQTYQFYKDKKLEKTILTIDKNSNNASNKKIYILVFNLRAGVTWKVINVN